MILYCIYEENKFLSENILVLDWLAVLAFPRDDTGGQQRTGNGSWAPTRAASVPSGLRITPAYLVLLGFLVLHHQRSQKQ